MDELANQLGLTTDQLTTLIIAGFALLAGWYILRRALRMAMRSFTIGCFGLLVIVGLLYAVFVIGS